MHTFLAMQCFTSKVLCVRGFFSSSSARGRCSIKDSDLIIPFTDCNHACCCPEMHAMRHEQRLQARCQLLGDVLRNSYQRFFTARRLPHTQLKCSHSRRRHPATVTIIQSRRQPVPDNPAAPALQGPSDVIRSPTCIVRTSGDTKLMYTAKH